MMRNTLNPFSFGAIVSQDQFCNRLSETADIMKAMKNGERLFVYAERRTGKTSLVLQAAKKLSTRDYIVVYMDMWATGDEHSFAALFAQTIAKSLESKAAKMVEVAKIFFGRFMPSVSFDKEGNPLLSLKLGSGQLTESDLTELLETPERVATKRKKQVVMIFDEFQRIADYPDDHVERRLRSVIQHQKNVSYIFLGSRRHIIRQLFLSANRPLYRSAGHYPLKMISLEAWQPFILEKFKSNGKKISTEVITRIVSSTEGHPFYTQHLCHLLWERTAEGKEATPELFAQSLTTLLDREHYAYSAIWELLTPLQRRLLMAIAVEDDPDLLPFSADFILKHGLRSASSVQRALTALKEKDLIDGDGETPIIIDRFFKLWLQRVSIH